MAVKQYYMCMSLVIWDFTLFVSSAGFAASEAFYLILFIFYPQKCCFNQFV